MAGIAALPAIPICGESRFNFNVMQFTAGFMKYFPSAHRQAPNHTDILFTEMPQLVSWSRRKNVIIDSCQVNDPV